MITMRMQPWFAVPLQNVAGKREHVDLFLDGDLSVAPLLSIEAEELYCQPFSRVAAQFEQLIS